MTTPPCAGPAWREPSITYAARPAQPLLAAFLTTFEPPDAAVLVEDLLPTWLGLSNSLTGEGQERLRYFAELEEALKTLRGRFTIISSSGGQPPGAHGWIWSYIRRLQVGFRQAAVQHAKVWLFHRAGSKSEPQTLEVVVSSQNLTREALRDQVQAGWRCVVPLADASSTKRALSWGPLPEFLEQLSAACGAGGARAVPYWMDVLGRAACPEATSFVASVPGRHSARPRQGTQAWGVAALRRLAGREARSLVAMVPTIGQWDRGSLARWLQVAGIDRRGLAIAWIEPSHPWATRWQLNGQSEAALRAAEIGWLQLPCPEASQQWRSPLCDEHKAGDTRWSHAKLYELNAGRRPKLLLTSANFSRAAWGDAQEDRTLVIDNFEFGVLVDARSRIARGARARDFVHATTATDFERAFDLPIAWMAASWDGAQLRVQLRLAEGTRLRNAFYVQVARDPRMRRVSLRGLRPPELRVKWPLAMGVPLRVQLAATSGEPCEVAVEDLRPIAAGEWLCDVCEEAELQELADELLEEKYRFFDEDGAPDPDGKGRGRSPGTPSASYSVPAYEDARRRFAAIDQWSGELEKSDAQLRSGVLQDGVRLARRWHSIAAQTVRTDISVSARLAAKELDARIRKQRGL